MKHLLVLILTSTITVLFNEQCLGTAIRIDLNGNWTIQDPNGKYPNMVAHVPGGIYSDLQRNNIIENIFQQFNDKATRWVAKQNWTYSHKFFVPEQFNSNHALNLVFEGVDTFATIHVNNHFVGQCSNMFVRYIYDIKSYVQFGANNTLQVAFQSPIEVAKKRAASRDYPIPPQCPPPQYNGECHVNEIRKMQASFAWDWGPAFPSIGIYKDVYLEAYNTTTIRYIVASTTEQSDYFLLNVTTFMSDQFSGDLIYQLILDYENITKIVNVHNQNMVNAYIPVPTIKVLKWWPNGYGNQKLYDLFVSILNTDQSKLKTRIGFRTVDLVQSRTNSGLDFYFKVNGIPIFAKGSNVIPVSIIPENDSNISTITQLLRSAADVNMNMLRVWGGGLYESDEFYNLADELGLMIWQDFMFACAMYPSNEEFLSEVREEVQHQVKRLDTHPSIVLWAANNENEAALTMNWYGTSGANLSRYKADYRKLYIDTIYKEFQRFSNKPFLTSSPTNGDQSTVENYLAKNPQSVHYGDIHYYNYLWDSLNALYYPIPRFASEYGYQSLPNLQTWLESASGLNESAIWSAFLNHRQHKPEGQLTHDLLISYHFNIPAPNCSLYSTLYTYYSQLLQALSVKVETEHYRSYMGRINENGEGNTMGALYWQLNDVWAAPTWASIDYNGRWKMLHYFAKQYFASLIVTYHGTLTGDVELFVVSDFVSDLKLVSINNTEMNLIVEALKWGSSFEPIKTFKYPFQFEFGKSLLVESINVDDHCKPLQKVDCLLRLSVDTQNSIIQSPPTNYVFPTNFKEANLQTVQLKIEKVTQFDNSAKIFEIVLSSNGIALFVWLDTHNIKGRFNDNGFIQMAHTHSIKFFADTPITATALRKAITITYLNSEAFKNCQ